jgi:hypothetical protein
VDNVVCEGDRLKGDGPVARDNFGMFVDDGVADAERPNMFDQIAERHATEDPAPPHDVALLEAPSLFSAVVVALTRDITVGIGTDGKGHPAELRAFKKGTKFLADSELVRALPEAFAIPRAAGAGLRSKPT